MAMDPQLVRLLDNVQVRCPGATTGAIQLEYWNALDEFFQGSNCWLDTSEIMTEPNVWEYEIAPEEPGDMHRLMWVQTDMPNWRDRNRISATMPTVGTLMLECPPVQPTSYLVTTAITVSAQKVDTAYPTIPDWFLGKFSNPGILDGILMRLMLQPGKPYSNMELAKLHGLRFEGAQNQAASEMRRQNTFGAQAWAFPQSFATRRVRW